MFQGILTALVTPFREDDSINLELIATLIERQLAAGISGIVVTAGVGEYVSLQPDERIQIIRCAADALQGKLPLIAGILEPTTHSAVTASLAARDAGAQALLVLTPYYVKPSDEGLVRHFQIIAEQTDSPIIVYNNPARTGINLDVQVLEELAAIPQVVAVKECDRDLGRVACKIERLGARLSFLSGEDDLLLPALSIGARGAIMAASNLVASWAVELFKRVEARDLDRARRIHAQLLKFVALYDGPNHPAPLKAVMRCAGLPVGQGRPPLESPSQARLDEITCRLSELGSLSETYTASHDAKLQSP